MSKESETTEELDTSGLKDRNVLMLHQFHQPHHAHRVFGDAVDADYRHFETGNEPGGSETNLDSMLARLQTAVTVEDYDVVIGEGTIPIYTLLFYKTFNNWDADIIPLIADETFAKVMNQRTHHIWKHGLSQVINKMVIGAIAVGALPQFWAERYLKVPIRVVHPPISATKYEALSSITPKYNQKEKIKEPQILHAGTVSDQAAVEKKNVARLSEVVSCHPEWELRLLGSGHELFPYSNHPNVRALGYIEKLEDFVAEFINADVYVQPSTGDAFPVASLEAMLAGVITVVSTETGTRELVEAVDPSLVQPPTTVGIEQGIDYALSLTPVERQERSKALSKRAAKFTEHNQAKIFSRTLEELIK